MLLWQKIDAWPGRKIPCSSTHEESDGLFFRLLRKIGNLVAWHNNVLLNLIVFTDSLSSNCTPSVVLPGGIRTGLNRDGRTGNGPLFF
jgi:hypothetical protein